jgi:hypothetical protein
MIERTLGSEPYPSARKLNKHASLSGVRRKISHDQPKTASCRMFWDQICITLPNAL